MSRVDDWHFFAAIGTGRLAEPKSCRSRSRLGRITHRKESPMLRFLALVTILFAMSCGASRQNPQKRTPTDQCDTDDPPVWCPPPPEQF